LMNEAVPRQGILRSSVTHSAQMLSLSDARTEVFSKLKVNGVGGLRIYFGSTHSAFS
jgi:hypothetical protein